MLRPPVAIRSRPQTRSWKAPKQISWGRTGNALGSFIRERLEYRLPECQYPCPESGMENQIDDGNGQFLHSIVEPTRHEREQQVGAERREPVKEDRRGE